MTESGASNGHHSVIDKALLFKVEKTGQNSKYKKIVKADCKTRCDFIILTAGSGFLKDKP